MTTTIEDTFNPAALSSGLVTGGGSGSGGAGSSTKGLVNATPKQTKTTQNYPRIEFEPLYTDLKACIGHSWAIYHDALTRFMRGELSASEFGYLTDDFIYATPATEHAHNALVCAIIHNTGRDSPEPGPASWVSATSEKTAGASSNKPAIISDAGEQRLKTEIMALPPRDRRRLKAIINEKAEEDGSSVKRNGYEEYYSAGRIKAPESAPSNAGGLTKTNWELEIKKRYAQPLFSETLEFPEASTIYARMVPICYEESVGAGSSMHCAEMVASAAEVFLKGFLGEVFIRTRANGPRYENGAGGGILTASYKRQLVKEEEDVKLGKLARNRDNGLIPIESQVANARTPLTMDDLKLASHVGPNLWNGMPLLGMQVNEAATESEYDEWRAEKDAHSLTITNGVMENGIDDMDLDDDDYGWEGTGGGERETLGSLLEECLAIRA